MRSNIEILYFFRLRGSTKFSLDAGNDSHVPMSDHLLDGQDPIAISASARSPPPPPPTIANDSL